MLLFALRCRGRTLPTFDARLKSFLRSCNRWVLVSTRVKPGHHLLEVTNLLHLPVAGRVRAAWVDRQARKGAGPSDHAPVIVDLDEAPDGDIGPVVPPPSAAAARSGSVKLPQSRG